MTPPARDIALVQVGVRVLLRVALLGAFATFGSQGFVRTLASLLLLSVLICAFFALARRELVFGPVLTHWDEAAAYGAVGLLLSAAA